MKSHRHIAALAVVVASFALASCAREKVPQEKHADVHEILETKDLPPMITVSDLAPLGFDTTTLYMIEAHVHVLNGALVTVAELKRSFDATTDERHRQRLNAYAIPFHVTADMHQRAILNVLRPPLDTTFDRYVESRKKTAGLEDWHTDHRAQGSGSELPGLTPVPRRTPH